MDTPPTVARVITRRSVTLNGRAHSVLDSGGDGPPLLALHGTFGRSDIFARLAADLAPDWRVIAPDQRGHGRSPRGGDFSRRAFVDDAAALAASLATGPVAVLGHSLGGLNAYQLAAHHPDLVRALVVVDNGAVTGPPEVPTPILDVRDWPRLAPSRQALTDHLAEAGIPVADYFLASAEPAPGGGWRYCFDLDDMMAVQRAGVGDWWRDWLGSSCPALLLRGEHSHLLSADHARDMVRRRTAPTSLVEFPGCGHWLYEDDPVRFADTVREFLGR